MSLDDSTAQVHGFAPKGAQGRSLSSVVESSNRDNPKIAHQTKPEFTEHSTVPRWALHRRLYDWVLSFARQPYATTALFVMSFAEASFFPIPPDVLLIPMALEQRKRAWWFALVCTAASVLGGLAGYFIGYAAWSAISSYVYQTHIISQASFDAAMAWYGRYGFWVVFIAGFTPIPYKVFTIAAGVFSMFLPAFILASVISRGARFFLLAALMWKFGQPMKKLIDKYFNLLTISVVVLGVGGFVALKLLG